MAQAFDGEDLQQFNMDELQSIFDAPPAAHKNSEIELTDDRTLLRKSKREQLHMLEVANAAKQMQKLPPKGYTLHCIMRGNFNGWDLVPATLQLAAPATIRTLYVATLGFNEQNAAELIDQVDRGRVGSVAFICSVYFRSTTPEVWDKLHYDLTSRGHRAASIRSHAKILLMETTDDNWYVVESSANLRSCRNIEQFAMTNDKELFNFHRDWMDNVITKASKPTPCPAEDLTSPPSSKSSPAIQENAPSPSRRKRSQPSARRST